MGTNFASPDELAPHETLEVILEEMAAAGDVLNVEHYTDEELDFIGDGSKFSPSEFEEMRRGK